MAANQFSASPVMVHQQFHPYGHEIRYNFALRNAAALQEEWTFTEDCQLSCQISPTSWKFKMTLERARNILVVSGTAKLKRYDSINIPVEVFLVVKIHHEKFRDYIPIPNVDKMILPGEELIINVSNIVPHAFNYLLSEELSVLVHIYVRDCHRRIRKHLGTRDDKEKKEKKSRCSEM
ncbi:hypothetical protein AVEN_270734-1 [Araneus ventricosus]|uniref:Uncharacterized protein n=1 Tax=Araneus ventricosus TaxID=182803 RepID=A0A4Y2PMC5_ARAVE|nr:hypothetical protein AVEN_270408-1 [Araneus ventricosus]GBN51796.1 hypothetical protein AVEN_270734-1 [Araneus ventricosus]